MQNEGKTVMLRGFATVSYYAADLEAAAAWYSEVLGIEPYYRVPGYIEFRVGDDEDELGLIDARYRPPAPEGPAGEVIHWHVDDLPAAYERLLGLGGTSYQPPTEHGPGFVTASVVDPFGNILGVMFNQHWADAHARDAVAAPAAG